MNLRPGRAAVAIFLLLTALRLHGQTITNFSPKFGTNGDQIIVTGTGFVGGGGSSQTKVFFWNGTSDSVQVPVANVFVGDANTITVQNVPNGIQTGPIAVQNGSGTKNQSGENFTVVGPGPYLTDFTPTSGSRNDPVLINGVHLANTTSVKFNGIATAGFGASAEQLSVNVPATATFGTNFISVTTPLGTMTNPAPFYVYGLGPFVTSFDPVGGSESQKVTILGGHFISGSATGVNFNGRPGTGFHISTDDQLEVFPPSGVTTGPLTVLSGLGSTSNFITSSNFFGPPVVTAFAPPVGRSNTNLVLTGTNFIGATGVVFFTTNGPFNLTVPPTPGTVTSNSLQVVVPNGATNGPIRVLVPANLSFTTSSNFNVLPSIFSFSPGHGASQTNVVVTGANFNAGGLTVKFGGVNAQSVSGVSFGQLTATVAAATTNGPIIVTTISGSVTSTAVFYLPPSVSGFSPTNSGAGSTVTITGQNLLGATNVSFNGSGMSIPPGTNNTILPVTVPGGVITGPIGVITPGGSADSGSRLFYGMPLITSFNPTHGLPGTVVSIFGTNFLGASAVGFNGTNTTPGVINNGRIDVSAPGDTFTGPITVTAPAGTAVSSTPFTFDFLSDFVVTGVESPDPVYVGSNLTYTIVISNAGPFSAPFSVFTNQLPASVNLKSASITVGTISTNASRITVNFGTFTVGTRATLTAVVVPQSIGSIVDTANASSEYPDPTPADALLTLTTTVQPLPVLTIQRYSPLQVQISWPSALSNFVLQFKNDLGSTNAWANVPTPPFTVGDQKIVIDAVGSSAAFYRLKQ